MASLLDSLDRLHVSAVGIYATDKRDHLFLAQEISRRSPNVLLFAVESSLIYLHPDFRSYLRGTLVASPSPLFNLTQVLAGRPNTRRLVQFPNSAAATVYNALLALLDRPDRMLDYGSHCGRSEPGQPTPPAERLANCAPSVWLSVVGEEDIWPLERVRPLLSVNQGYSWPGVDGALYRPLPRFDESRTAAADWPHPTLFLLMGLTLVLLLHGVIAAGILCDLAGYPWLRRLLPMIVVHEDHRDPPARGGAADEACRLVACGLHIRADDVHAIMDVEVIDQEAFLVDVCTHDPFQATITWARLEIFAGPLSRALQRGPWAHNPYPTEAPDKPEWQREAETFLALQLAYALRHVLVRLLSGLTMALAGFALILAAHLFYVFQGRAFWLTMDWVNLGVATGLAVLLLVKLEKDAVLSRLWSTTPGRVDWSGAFVQRMLVYGALPVVTLFATFFPEVGQSIFAWLEPVKKVLP